MKTTKLNVISMKELCEELNCSRDSIKLWVKERGFPKRLPSPTRDPYFDTDKVRDWLRGENNETR